MNTLVALCVVVSAAVSAYDFQDAEFNQLLASDLEDGFDSLYSLPVNSRVRRAEEAVTQSPNEDDKCKKRHRRPKACCADELLDQIHEKDKELVRSCFREVLGVDKHEHHRRGDPFSCEQAEKRRNDMTCVFQCVGQKKGVVGEDGKPKPEEITKTLKENFAKESWFEPSIEKVVSTCLKEAENATATQVKPASEDVKICNPSGITLKHCIFREVQLSCPADQIKDQKACERFQERIKKGIHFFEPAPPPFDGPRDE
ncbi:uncharacterized protein LOC115875193 [Sitophilus oryzae]|uniref:Uncharacterized protein LOC115875193 n=1 Tax=Sitophilus oryzae TaxID=7048 RepID=A0A6J2X5I9_SITOR|nr:uncharacterized protein LOC115875193 [Sitophilus oryzae]